MLIIQDRHYALLQRAAKATTDMLDAIVAAKKAGATEAGLRDAAALHRKAQWRLDFVAAENSMGFHAPQDPAEVETPGLLWQILANRQPLSPYHRLTAIFNPWGYGSFPFSIRLSEASVVDLVVRRIEDRLSLSGKPITRIGGRLLGRYWYNSAYGGAR